MGAKITPAAAGLVAAFQADMAVANSEGTCAKRLAASVDRSKTWAAEMLRGKQPFPRAKLDVWADLTGGRHLARWVARICGCDLVERAVSNVESSALEVMVESGQVPQVVSTALLDGAVTAEEVAVYQREMH